MLSLLRLPMLALKEIFQDMEPRELFFTSILSKRTKEAIELWIPKKSIYVAFYVSQNFSVSMDSFHLVTSWAEIDYSHSYKVGTETICFPQVSDHCHWVETSSKEKCIMSMIHHCVEIFNNLIVSLMCTDGTKEELAVEIVRYLKQRNLKNAYISIGLNLTAQHYTAILNEANDVKLVHIRSDLPIDYQYCSPVEFETDTLKLEGSYPRIRLTDFIQCKDIEIDSIHNSLQITVEDLNAFFKKVISTDCRMQALKITFTKPVTFPIVVQGLFEGPVIQNNKILIQKQDGTQWPVWLEGMVIRMGCPS